MNIESLEIEGWNTLQTGVVLAESKEWLLVAHIPVDYVLDGYRLYNKNFIKNRMNSARERFIERVFKLRKLIIPFPAEFEFSDIVGLLKWSQAKFGLFEFQDDETELFYGRLNRIVGNEFNHRFYRFHRQR